MNDLEARIRFKNHDDRDVFVLFMNYMIKKKYEAAGGSVNNSRMDTSGARPIRHSSTKLHPGSLQLKPNSVTSQIVNPSQKDTPQLGKKNVEVDQQNDSYLFEAKPVSKISNASVNPYSDNQQQYNQHNNFNGGKSSGVWAAGGITGNTNPELYPKPPVTKYDDQSGIRTYEILSSQMKKQPNPTEILPSAMATTTQPEFIKLKTDYELLKRKYEILLEDNAQMKNRLSAIDENQRGQSLLRSELDQVKIDMNFLKSENQKLKIKNNTLIEEIGIELVMQICLTTRGMNS